MGQCVGTIDGCLVPISAPNHLHADYCNRKGQYSILIQGAVDAKYHFVNVWVGWPGSVHDARVFVLSVLCNEMEHKHILPNKTITVSGVQIPLYMIGDSAYPLESWLMKPFHWQYWSNPQGNYNYRVCRAWISVEIVLSRLMGEILPLNEAEFG